MADTTTIEVTKEQRDQLKEMKEYDREPIRDVVEQLLSGDGESSDRAATKKDIERLKEDLSEADELSDDVSLERVLGRIEDLEARLPVKVREELS